MKENKLRTEINEEISTQNLKLYNLCDFGISYVTVTRLIKFGITLDGIKEDYYEELKKVWKPESTFYEKIIIVISNNKNIFNYISLYQLIYFGVSENIIKNSKNLGISNVDEIINSNRIEIEKKYGLSHSVSNKIVNALICLRSIYGLEALEKQVHEKKYNQTIDDKKNNYNLFLRVLQNITTFEFLSKNEIKYVLRNNED